MIESNGTQHVRFDRKSRGLRVINGDVLVHSNANSKLAGLSHSGGGIAKSQRSVYARDAGNRRW